MILRITMAWFLIGLVVFYTMATFPSLQYNNWSHTYYIWSKANDMLLAVTILFRPKQYRIIIPVIFFMGIRFVWEIISIITGVSVNNTKAIGILFIILSCVCLLIIIKEAIRWQRQKY